MKLLVTGLLMTWSASVFAQQCPNLVGSYDCNFPNKKVLKIEQEIVSTEDGLTSYKLFLAGDLDEPTPILGSPNGRMDDYGYVIKCADEQLVASDQDDTIKLYLNQTGHLIREVSGSEAWKCNRL
jgi:hypothetical protein